MVAITAVTIVTLDRQNSVTTDREMAAGIQSNRSPNYSAFIEKSRRTLAYRGTSNETTKENQTTSSSETSGSSAKP